MNQPQDLVQCGINGVAEFDISQTRTEINDQPQTSIKYYGSLGNAIDQNGEIQRTYTSTQERKTIFARVENMHTGCYQVVEFDLVKPPGPGIKEKLSYELCDIDSDGIEIFDLVSLEGEMLQDLDDSDLQITYFSAIGMLRTTKIECP